MELKNVSEFLNHFSTLLVGVVENHQRELFWKVSTQFQNWKRSTTNGGGFFLNGDGQGFFQMLLNVRASRIELAQYRVTVGYVLRSHTTHDMTEGIKTKREVRCCGRGDLCSQSLINHGRMQECITICCVVFVFCSSFYLFTFNPNILNTYFWKKKCNSGGVFHF